MSNDMVTLQVYRFDPEGSASPHYDEFRIPYSKGLTVLEGLIYIYENIDSSLSFVEGTNDIADMAVQTFV